MKLIYDIGAHTGRDTEFYLKKGFNVVAVEAYGMNALLLEGRLYSYIIRGQLKVEPVAISDHYGFMDLLINTSHDDWGTACPSWNKQFDGKIEKVEVRCKTLPEIISDYGEPYYIKIDIEGMDAMAIRQLKGYYKPPYISAELLTYNNILDKNVNCLEVINALLDLGYTKFQLVDQGKNHLVKCPYPPREGEYVDYEFDGYCSGLFGEELPDKWVGVEEIMLQYIHYFYRKPNCSGESLDDGSWFDIHAKL